MTTCHLNALGMINALGADLKAIAPPLLAGTPGSLSPRSLRAVDAAVPVGAIHTDLPPLPDRLHSYQCRNHRLAWAALMQIRDAVEAAKSRFGPARIGVVVGSSTSGISASEEMFYQWREDGLRQRNYSFPHQHTMASVAEVIARAVEVCGPAFTVSTACSSGAKAMVSAMSLLHRGICDAVITGGVDSLCDLTLNGFEALASLSRKPCNPMSRNRDGLNIGEGAAFFLMSEMPGPVRLCSAGESSDAHHVSAPHPEGAGAELAMRRALARAGLRPDAISYLNLHGTGTRLNDAMEARAVARVFGPGLLCSSTKPMTGHCLGAAGAIEAGFCWIAMTQGTGPTYPLPPHCWDQEADEEMPRLNFTRPGDTTRGVQPVHFMSNSYAFGGNNCSLIFEALEG